MSLTAAEKKHFRAIAHNLNPVIIVGDKGVSDALVEELKRALHDHELIKLKVALGDRQSRQEIIASLCEQTGAELVQSIGKVAVLFLKNARPNPKLSNLIR